MDSQLISEISSAINMVAKVIELCVLTIILGGIASTRTISAAGLQYKKTLIKISVAL
jgi:hypothetical protein